MIPMIEVSGEAQASAALSLTTALIQKLTLKNVLTKNEAIDLYDALAKAKESKAALHGKPVEEEAAALLAHLAARLREIL